MFSLFVNRSRGRVTTFGVIINALVTTTMLPYCVVIWGVSKPAHAESVSLALPLQLSARVPDGDVPPTAPADVPSLPLMPPNVADIDGLSVQSPADPAPTEAAAEMPEEQRIRLARFLPKVDSGAMPPLDNLLAKAYTVRSTPRESGGGAIHVYRSGRQLTNPTDGEEGESDSAAGTTAKAMSPDGEAEASQLLDAGDALLEQSRVAEAALTYFDIVNYWPASSASEAVDTVMNALALDAEKGSLDIGQLLTFADGLPMYTECQSDKAVYWLAAAQQIAGNALKQAGRLDEARTYLEAGRDISLAAMRDLPGSPCQIFIPGHYLLSCKDLGREALQEGIKSLRGVVVSEENASILKFSARRAMAVSLHNDFNDNLEGAMELGNLLEEYPGSDTEQYLAAGDSSANIQAHIVFCLAYAHFQLSHFQEARACFDRVVQDYPENQRLVDAAAYMSAYMLELTDLNATKSILDAYYRYIDQYPEGAFLDRAMMRMAGVFERTNALNSAAAVYRQLVAFFPDAEWRGKIENLAEDREAKVAAGMEDRLQLEALLGAYGSQICGPYALALLLESQDQQANLQNLADIAGTESSGTSLSGLLSAATAVGLTAYADKADTIAAFRAPLVAHLSSNHYVFVPPLLPSKLPMRTYPGLVRSPLRILMPGFPDMS